jgi:hypothetical protein
MAKKQTRRSISVKGITYQRLKAYCDANKKSVSGYLEEIIAEKLDAMGAPVPTTLRPKDPEPGKVKPEPVEPETEKVETVEVEVVVEITTTEEFSDHDDDEPKHLPTRYGEPSAFTTTVTTSTSPNRQTGDHKKWD